MMELWRIFVLAVFFGFQLMFPAAAAESQSDLTCNVTMQSNGSVQYQLSLPSSAPCSTNWEDINKTAVAHDSTFHPDLVVKLTNSSITLKHCQDYIRFAQTCPGSFEEVECRVNCSRLKWDQPNLTAVKTPPSVNNMLYCLSLCMDKSTFGWVVFGIIFAVVVGVVSLFLGLYWKCKRRTAQSAVKTTSYTPANEQIKVLIV